MEQLPQSPAIGMNILEYEQEGSDRATYGTKLLSAFLKT